ncbi:MAG: hypothetical protein KY410_08015 [Proteobacteria bacterium]|nr:hypothetical protein [Pseudomonadota bacterium]
MNDAKSNGWKQTGWIAIAVLLLGVAGWEVAFTALGGSRQPVVDDADLWAEWRERATRAREGDLILVGASRMQLDVDIATLERVTGKHVYQLAIDGTSFLPVLADLARDPRIRANVIVSVRAPDLTGQGVERAQQMVNYYRHRAEARFASPAQYTERVLKDAAYAFVPSREQGVRPETLYALWQGDRRISSYITTYASREREGDYSKIDVKALRELRYRRSVDWYRKSAQAPAETVDRNIQFLRAVIEAIRQRGGNVIFVRFPISEALFAASEKHLPHERYLGRITQETGARLISFEDYPSLRGFDLPDGSHLDAKDQEAFTEALAKILLEKRE